MPELPEVQTVVDNLIGLKIVGCCIAGAKVYWPRTITGMTPGAFCKRIEGRTIQQLTRRGKYIVMGLSQGLTLLIHLRMTGHLNWELKSKTRNRHEHVILDLGEKRELRFQDTRKFGCFFSPKTPGLSWENWGPNPWQMILL